MPPNGARQNVSSGDGRCNEKSAFACASSAPGVLVNYSASIVRRFRPYCVRPGEASLAGCHWARKTKVEDATDRLFRSVADAGQTITDFDRRDIELVAISEGFDMTNPYGRAMAQMASVFAELERTMIRERTRAAMKVKRGRRERISRQTTPPG